MHKYRMAFLSGLAAGFVVGARAGRERYEQLKKLARSAADNPAVQQAAGALQAQTVEFAKTAGQKVTDQVKGRIPGMAKSAGRGDRKRDANGSVDGPGDQSLAAARDKPRRKSG
ncbi:MAG TPA: YtxH domain-containing protein [Streptosporangiaceae bacterium]|jgi:hypothetical protein